MLCRKIIPEKKYKDCYKEFSLLFNALDEYVLIVDEENSILNANKSALLRLGYTYEEICGMKLSNIYLARSTDEAGDFIRNIIRGRISKCKMELRIKYGMKIVTEACFFIGKWKDKTAVYIICKESTGTSELNISLEVINQK